MSWNTQPGARLGNGLRWWALPWPTRHLGPRSPWRPPGVAASLNTCPVPNSTQVRASTSECSVALYRSASALPVEHPGIGVGACGTMASYYGYFEGHAYPGAAAALGTLRLPAPTCPHKSGVPLAAGVVATLYSGPLPEGSCEAAWHEAHWSFVLTGDLNGGTHGDATVPGRQVASEVVSYLRGRSLPGDHGYMESDIAGDGLHTGTYWQRGRDVYVASTYRGTLPALALAVAPYPSGAGGGRPSNRRSRRP